jgi:hypothetical protein
MIRAPLGRGNAEQAYIGARIAVYLLFGSINRILDNTPFKQFSVHALLL